MEKYPTSATILIVDDTPTNLGILFEQLQNHGFKVLVDDGASAMRIIRQVQPDLILLDIMMPGLDGFEMCRRLKAHEQTRDIPVIFMTALTDPQDEIKGFEVGAVDYITKPIRVQTVLARVQTHLTLRNLQKRLEAQNVALQQEIAERQRTEIQLTQAKNQWEDTFHAVPDLMAILDRHHQIVRVNKAMATRLHLSPEHCIGQLCYQCIHKTDAPPSSCPHALLLQDGQEHTAEIHEPALEGDFLVTTAPLFNPDGTLFGSVHIARDITELKDLITKEHQQRKMADSLREVAMILNSSLDQRTVLHVILEQLRRVVNYDSAAIFLREGEDLMLCEGMAIAPDYYGRRIALSSTSPAAEVFHLEQPLFISDVLQDAHWDVWDQNTIRSWLGVPLCTGQTTLGVLTVDSFHPGGYTEQDVQVMQVFANQAALAIQNARLFEEIRDAKELAETISAELRTLNTTKDKFFSILAHDLRGPLGSLRTLTDFLVEHIESYSKEKLIQILITQRDAVKNLTALLENLLTWSRIQRGTLPYQPETLRLDMIVMRTIELLAPHAQHKQITVTTTIHENMEAYADLQMINTVVRNLLSNALKFTETGGQVTISAIPTPHHIEVVITDTGIGIPPKQLSELFRIDTKYQRKGTQNEDGTGLGLVLCKEFVERNGGTIQAESTVGSGTTFRFTLPRNPTIPSSTAE